MRLLTLSAFFRRLPQKSSQISDSVKKILNTVGISKLFEAFGQRAAVSLFTIKAE